MKFYVQYEMWNDSYAVLIGSLDNNNQISTAATEIIFSPYEKGTLAKPVLNLSPHNAQRFLQALWDAGLRPNDEGSVGQLAAVKYHLEDMRKLVFANTDHKPGEERRG